MPETIPNHIFKRAAQITDLFPDVPFMTLANIINADYLAEHSHTVSTIQPEEAKLDAESEPNKPRYRRRTMKRVVVNGKEYHATNTNLLFRVLGIVQCYPGFLSNSSTRTVEIEAQRFAAILKVCNRGELTKYASYGFDGKFHTVILENGLVTKTYETDIP